MKAIDDEGDDDDNDYDDDFWTDDGEIRVCPAIKKVGG
jgi:hypothetical protein